MVDWVTVVTSVVLSAIGSGVVAEFRLRRELSVEESQEVDEWYDETAAYAAEMRRLWQRQWDQSDRPRMNFSEISSNISLLEGQISRHASEGEQLDVNRGVVDALDEVAIRCRDVGEHHGHLNDVEEIEGYRDRILDAVEDLEDELDSR